MKTLLNRTLASAASLMVGVSAFAASPTFNSFNTSRFTTSAGANSVDLKLSGIDTNYFSAATMRWISTNRMTVANAQDFGADPTGAMDSTAAIQAAIDSLGTIGGTVFIPRGFYGITGANTIHMRRNVTLEGEMSTYGGNGTQLSKTGSGACIMLAFTSCTIRNIHLVGQGVGHNQFGIISTNILDTAQSTTNFKLQDVKCEGFDVGFWIHNGWASEINTCYAQACRDGILLSNVVDSIRIIGGEYQNCTNGIHLAGGNIYRIPIECLMEVDVVGLLIEDDVAVDYNYGITLQNSWMEGNPVNIDATDVIQLQVINNTLSANAGGTNIIFRGGNRSSTISGNEIGGGCALHAVGSGVRGLLYENNYDSCTFPMVDSGTTGSIYVGANGLIGGNLVLKTGTYYGDGSGLTNLTGIGGGPFTNAVLRTTTGNTTQSQYDNSAPAFVTGADGTVYWLDKLSGTVVSYTNLASVVYIGKDTVINGGLTGTGTGPWVVGYLAAAGVVTNDASGNIGTLSYSALAVQLGVFGSTNSIFGGTFGTNILTGQSVFDAQGNLVHYSTNSTFMQFNREGTNGSPMLLSVTGTNSIVEGTNYISDSWVLVRSNSLAVLPVLAKGDNLYWSSNGIAYVICSSPAGVLTTNKLAP